MGAAAVAAPAPAARPGAAPMRPQTVRLVALAPLALFGGLHWAALLEHPRTGSMLLDLVVALAAGAALLSIPAGAPRGRRIAACAVVVPALLAVALLTAGVPAKFLEPAYWDDLLAGLGQGIASTPAVRVPYRGVDEWVRTAITAGGTALVAIAVLLATWPHAGRPHGRPLAAAVALGALYVVPVVENGPGHPFFGGAVFCVLLAGYLYAERLRSDQLGLAGLCLLIAAGAGALVAGRLDGPRPWLDYEALAEKLEPTKAEAFSWDHSYAPLNWPRDGREILRIKARTPLYWKAINLERFDGVRWSAGLVPRDDRSQGRLDRRWLQTVRVVDRGLRSREFVAAGDTLRILPGASKAALWVPDQTFVSASDRLAPGDSYAAQVYAPQPSEAQLRRATGDVSDAPQGDLEVRVPVARADQGLRDPLPPGAAIGGSVGVRFDGYGSGGGGPALVWPSGQSVTPGLGAAIVEHGPYARLYALTRRLARRAGGPYDLTQAILRRVRDGAVYDESPPVARYPLASFLFDERRGYCQQFSGTMAVMLRMAGIPARVASGFSPGVRNAERGDYVIEDTDAHSWVEAYFAPYGWVTLDPTPGASPARSQTSDTADTAGASAGGGGRTGSGALGQSGDRPFASGDPGGRLAPTPSGPDRTLIAVLGALAAALAAAAVVLWRRRPRFAPSAPELAELERALHRTGRTPEPSLTLARLESLLGAGDAGAAYVRELRRQRFAGVGEGPSGAHRRALRRELAAGLGITGRLRGWFALPPRPPAWRRRSAS